MHGPINIKSPNNISKWQMGFNSAFKGLITTVHYQTQTLVNIRITFLNIKEASIVPTQDKYLV
jgi:hypothetical protein